MKFVNILICCAIIALLTPVSAKAEIYGYQDKNGGLHFTDSLAEVPEGETPQVYNQSTEAKRFANETKVFREAGLAYQQRDFGKAVELYTEVLIFEKEDPSLQKNDWRVVVGNLGLSYSALGDTDKAKKTFEYGISNDQEYPMFYYNLARMYAESNDLDNSLLNLKKAFAYKRNLMPGEHLPNPATDASFARFMLNESFLRTLTELR